MEGWCGAVRCLPVDRLITVALCLCPSTRNCGSSTSLLMPTLLEPEFHLQRISRIVYPTKPGRQNRQSHVMRAEVAGSGPACAAHGRTLGVPDTRQINTSFPRARSSPVLYAERSPLRSRTASHQDIAPRSLPVRVPRGHHTEARSDRTQITSTHQMGITVLPRHHTQILPIAKKFSVNLIRRSH